MRRFWLKAMGALVGLLGLAMLDLGSCACAAFIPTASQSSPFVRPLDETCACGGAAETPCEQLDHANASRLSEAFRSLQMASQGMNGPVQGGAGSPSTTGTNTAGQAFGLMPVNDLSPPVLVTRLYARQVRLVPSPITFLVFEPPRAGV